jgi:predicted glycoside hydrolase/deacetylase ChbG (UPF0249 family)
MSYRTSPSRFLIVVADDFGIGPATSRGILDLALQGVVKASVLLVNSPYAEEAVRAWRQAGSPLELGWHACLTMDRPVLPPERVPSLVDATGAFPSLSRLMARLALGRVRRADLRAELQAQYQRFLDLVGRPPTSMNGHKHVQIVPPVGEVLLDILGRQRPLPYVRRLVEPLPLLAAIPGARCKRAYLATLGRRHARRQCRGGFPSNDYLAGVTDPRWVTDPHFFVRWLKRAPGRVVELMCHPGHRDETLLGRDCAANDGQLQRRRDELVLLQHPSFREACRQARFALVAPSELTSLPRKERSHAA